jgi:hypothetical protein
MNGAPGRSGSITIRTLVVMLIITNGVLGFMVVTLNGDVSRLGREAVRSKTVHALDDRVTSLEKALIAAAQSSGRQSRTVTDVDSDLKDLERALFGYTGPSAVSDIIGSLESRMDDLEFCINRVVSQVSTQLSLPTRFPSFSRC